MNAPGMGTAGPGQTAPAFPGGCNSANPATGNPALQVTIYYNFVPLTPFISNAIGGHLILDAKAVYRTEY